MKKLIVLLAAFGLLTGCGTENSVPQTVEEIDTFDEVLAFMSGQTETKVTAVQVQAENGHVPTEPVPLSGKDAEALLKLMETTPMTAERYDPLTVYGTVSYSVICTLENGETVTLYPKEDALSFTRAELNEEEKWHYPAYRLLYEDPAIPGKIDAAVRQLWSDAFAIPEGETRTAAQMLGDEILDARQVILRASYDGDSDTEIRLYVDTAKHPELLDTLTGLALEQTEMERDETSYVSVAFHTGEEDYRFGEHILTDMFFMHGERIEIGVGTVLAYCPAEPFAGWLKDWIYTHKDDDGVKIVRWDVE